MVDDDVRAARMNLGQLVVVAFMVLIAGRAALPQALPPPLPAGRVIESVVCVADSSETYALYLPSAYTPAKSWPIMYAFDPMARGEVPVSLYKDVAEKYGYIVVGSNHSRNFSLESSSKAANAMWQDTRLRFSLDPRRIYTTGFSGGARVAGMVAMGGTQCRIAGVIAFGAGYPNPGPARDSLFYFFGVGDQDFNWPEVMRIRREREAAGEPYRVRVFAGTHQWAPAEVMEDALQWMQLKAMQAGSIPVDAAFIDQRFQKLQAAAAEAAKQGNAIAEFSAYRSLVSDFGAPKEVGEEASRLAKLKASPEFKSALKKEDDQIGQQLTFTQDLMGELMQFGQTGVEDRLALRTEILRGIQSLKDRSEHARNDDQRLVLLRSLGTVWVNGMEAGQEQLRQKSYFRALDYFQLFGEAYPDQAWPALLSAETYVALGDKKQALKQLREAVRRRLKNPDALEKDDALQPLRGEPEYQKVIAEMEAK